MQHLYELNIKLFLLLFFIFGACSIAQTSNSGMLYVSENTQFSVVNDFQNAEPGEFYNDGEAFIYAHFKNDGVINFYNNTGLTRFIGQQPQAIAGSKESYFNNVEFYNSSTQAPFELSGLITIEGESNFFQGIIDNDNHGGSIFFGEQASHINTSNDSHVDGRVGHYGANDFIYPIGDGGFYRYAGTSELNDTQSIVESKYFLENSNETFSHELRSEFVEIINDQEYWTIENMGETESALITLSWSQETTPSEILEEPTEEMIHIVRWDENENRWVDEGGIVDNASQSVSTIVDQYGVFTLARIDDSEILPCQINVYNAVSPNNDGVNDYFSIDRGSNSCAENLRVEIYNRWGVKVFETNNYGEEGDLFDGFSRGRLDVDGEKQLPSGTYFYILNFDYQASDQAMETYKKAGYLYLNGN